MKSNVELLLEFVRVAKDIRKKLGEEKKCKLIIVDDNMQRLMDVLENYEISYGDKPKRKHRK